MLALSLALRPLFAFADHPASEPVKTTVCEIAKHPEAFDGKVVQLRGLVDSGVQDLPAGLADESCNGAVKFFMPDDADFARLVKSRAFQKLLKDVKKNPVVLATVTGLFHRAMPERKTETGLALQSVSEIVVAPQPHVKVQKR